VSTYCKQPDRHVPGMKCGYPLPCPHHTVIIDLQQETIKVPVGNATAQRIPDRLIAIGEALSADEKTTQED